jgi:hypothetical protein
MTDDTASPTCEIQPDSSRSPIGRRHPIAMAAALAVPLAAAAPAIAAAPAGEQDSAGKQVPGAQISGDGFAAASPAFTVGEESSQGSTRGGKLVSASGDGFSTPDATGARTPIGGGVVFRVNTDINFVTSSSASGAMVDASMTAPRNDVSTLNGGTTSATLGDAFDGYNALAVHVGPNPPARLPTTGDPEFVFYNRNGPATTSCGGREVDLNAQVVSGGLTMRRSVYVPADQPVARTLNVLTNTGGTPIEVTVYTSNNLGSDSNTQLFGSSSGDAAAGLDDSWVGTFQAFSGTTSSDLRLAHVLRGTHGPALRSVSFTNGDDNPTWSYQLTLQPGETRIIANYVVAEANKALAASRAAALADNPLTECMTSDETLQLANFDRAAPVFSNVPAPAAATAPGGSSATVTYTPPTATDAVDGPVAVSCTPPSGSSFSVGTTIVTCTAADSSSNRAQVTFPVVVTATPLPLPRVTGFALGVHCARPRSGQLTRLRARFSLAAAAAVTFRIERRALRAVPTSCPPARVRGRRARWRLVARASRQLGAGRQSVVFAARRGVAPRGALKLLGRRGLPPGRYRLVVKARNASGLVTAVRVFAVAAR